MSYKRKTRQMSDAERENLRRDYINLYNRKNYDQITLRVEKGTKDRFKEIACDLDMSMASLFMRWLNEYSNVYNSNSIHDFLSGFGNNNRDGDSK